MYDCAHLCGICTKIQTAHMLSWSLHKYDTQICKVLKYLKL